MVITQVFNSTTELTGLQKLSTKQLINIILRKDDVEVRLRNEIKLLKRANKVLEQEQTEVRVLI